MYGKIVSSNGIINFSNEQIEEEVVLEHPLILLTILAGQECEIFLNDDQDGIYLPRYFTQPFSIDKIPIWKFRIKRAGYNLYPDDSGIRMPFEYSYYGFY